MQHWFISLYHLFTSTPFNTLVCMYVPIYLYISGVYIYNVYLFYGDISSSAAGLYCL